MAALAFTELESGADSDSKQVYASGSFTIDENELIEIGVVNGKFGVAGTVTLSGHSLTWTQVQTTTWDLLGSSRGTVFRAMKGTAGISTGTITITISGTGNWGCSWIVVKVVNGVTGTNGSGAIGDTDTNTGYSTSHSANLTGFNDADGVLAFVAHSDTGVTITPGAGYTASTQVTVSGTWTMRAQWFAGVDENPSATSGTSDYWAVLANRVINATPGSSATTRSFGFVA